MLSHTLKGGPGLSFLDFVDEITLIGIQVFRFLIILQQCTECAPFDV